MDLEISNFTLLKEDPFLDGSEDLIRNHTEIEVSSALLIIIDVIGTVALFFLHLFSLACALLLIYILTKFQRLKVKNHVYIFHFAIAVVIDDLIVPFFDILRELVHEIFSVRFNSEFVCSVYEINRPVTLIKICCLVLLTVIWYVESFTLCQQIKIEMFRKYSVIAVYLVAVLQFVCLIRECFLPLYSYSILINSLNIIIYFLALVIVIVLNVSVYNKSLTSEQLQKKYIFIVGSCIILTWLPMYLESAYFSISMFDTGFTYTPIVAVCFYLADILMCSDCIIVVSLLGYYNKYFKMAYQGIFKCSVKKYAQENLDEDSDLEGIVDGDNATNI